METIALNTGYDYEYRKKLVDGQERKDKLRSAKYYVERATWLKAKIDSGEGDEVTEENLKSLDEWAEREGLTPYIAEVSA